MSNLKCLIIEDEKPASDLLKDYIANVPGMELVAVCEEVMTASALLAKEQVDVIFLDINLPRINGIDFIKNLPEKPAIVVTTAYSQYAVDGYELDVADYLMKPISFGRFLKAVQKVRKSSHNQDKGAAEDSSHAYFFVKSDSRYEKITTAEILFVEALQNYITIHCTGKKVVTYSSLRSIETYLPVKDFLRVQKSFIVAVSKIDRISGDDIVIGRHQIPISRSLKEEVMNAILSNKLYRHKG